MKLEELDYELPQELIAQEPLHRRDASRLLVLDRATGKVEHHMFTDLPGLLKPSLFVLNNTKVFPARLRANKATGGAAELLLIECLERTPERQQSLARSHQERWLGLGRGLRCGIDLTISSDFVARVLKDRGQGLFEVLLQSDQEVRQAIEHWGMTPLPPYIRRAASKEDRDRYQTVYASATGAVAAPTAGLHFTGEVLQNLKRHDHKLAELTLHVGPGTFRPIKSHSLDDHSLEQERLIIGSHVAEEIDRARTIGLPIVAVGTTVTRALESAVEESGKLKAFSGTTNLFIRPPFRFRVVDALITNFHLPRSTLLALVMAFAGADIIREAYREAIAHQYRFYSYGDAMLVRDSRSAVV